MAWLESLHPEVFTSEKLGFPISGLTCSMLKDLNVDDVPEVAALYADTFRMSGPKALFPLSLRQCFINALISFLVESPSHEHQGTNSVFAAMTSDLARDFGGYVLTGLTLNELKDIHDMNPAAFKAVIREIGSLDVHELITLIPRQKMDGLLSMTMPSVRSRRRRRSALEIGSLRHMSEAPGEVSEVGSRALCLPARKRNIWANNLISAYG